ncbi:MAG TPA: hypothetical protein VJ771_06030 [Candidatus Nitrosotalea sp.]|nr:hypothetical protein [Candidatus Nitrosotalea sp.]
MLEYFRIQTTHLTVERANNMSYVLSPVHLDEKFVIHGVPWEFKVLLR